MTNSICKQYAIKLEKENEKLRKEIKMLNAQIDSLIIENNDIILTYEEVMKINEALSNIPIKEKK